MFRLCFIIFLSLTLTNLSEASQEEKNPSAVLVGSVYCDTCFQQSFSKTSHFISGAVVAVECLGDKTTPQFTKEVSTNEHGEFKVHLPFSVNKHVNKINSCSVKLIKSSEPLCAEASTTTSTTLHLKSKQEGTHIFSAGFFSFNPLKQPKLCDQKPSVQESKAFESQKSSSNLGDIRYPPQNENPGTYHLPPVVKDEIAFPSLPNFPLLPNFPSLPNLPPLPALPPLPSLPGIPFLPLFPPISSAVKDTKKTSQDCNEKVTATQFFGPNPFMPPSPPTTIFNPIMTSPSTTMFPPIIPTPPTSLFPPIIPSPFTSPPSLFPPDNVLPVVPDLSSSPFPPPPPVFQSLPAFPFQPTTGLPRTPPVP